MVARNNIYLPGTLAIYLLFLLLCRTIYIKKYIELLGLKYLIINTFKVFTKMHISCVDKQKETLLKLANYKMPFGKYKGVRLSKIPEAYYIWFSEKGLPSGELGELMGAMLEIKTNGLEYILKPLEKN